MECRLDFCSRPVKYRGKMLCASHGAQEYRGVEFTDLTRPKARSCEFPGCGRKMEGFGYCSTHLAQKRSNKPLRPVKRVRPKGAYLIRNSEGMKFCSVGDHWVPPSNFHACSSNPDKLQPTCKDCTKERSKRNKLKIRCRKYNISVDKFEEMRTQQEGLCAICFRDFGAGHIDHDHSCCPGFGSCGECIRGILCLSCNQGLGLLGDSPRTVYNLIVYITSSDTKFKEWLDQQRDAHLNAFKMAPRSPDSPQKVRDRTLRSKYMLTSHIVDSILDRQGGCAGCGISDGTWHVDHDHSCCPGKYTCGDCIRGVLCKACNQGLGLFKDSPQLLEGVLYYLQGYLYEG